jgi:hypothetical protein
MFNTVEEIAQDIIKNTPDIKEFLDFKSTDFMHNRALYIEFPRWIRNTYKLWDVRHPLTKAWHDGKRLLIDGIDCTPEHPDNISAAIMRRIKKQLAP